MNLDDVLRLLFLTLSALLCGATLWLTFRLRKAWLLLALASFTILLGGSVYRSTAMWGEPLTWNLIGPYMLAVVLGLAALYAYRGTERD